MLLDREFLSVSPEVAKALESHAPVVALETTILSHGLPWPDNLAIARECEQAVRARGAMPATLAIRDGRVCVGVDDEQIEFFCRKSTPIAKVNLQNFAATLQARMPGALTVGASLQACALAGIRVFATGGIGGVHRGFSESLDLSSDLTALSRFPAAVVCAGAKSILDVRATLEALETLGVPVAGVGTDCFPLFFTAKSAYQLDYRYDSMRDLAALCATQFTIGGSAVLAVAPVPTADEIPTDQLEKWTEQAIQDLQRAGVSGKNATPFLLSRLEQISGGKTLKTNRALVVNNCGIAASLALELSHFC